MGLRSVATFEPHPNLPWLLARLDVNDPRATADGTIFRVRLCRAAAAVDV